jgi:rSAM/selenodomain-associated transferase 2
MLSAVIPALNAEAGLGACLAALAEADEIVVADGGSTDRTVEIGAAAGARIIRPGKGRGLQLHAGAEVASGDWLLFLHADTRLGAGWREAVRRHSERQPQSTAYFRFRLDDAAWQARLVERGVALRVRLFGVPYGDQGLLVPRALYDAVGGYAPLPLMEDVDFVRRLRARPVLLEAEAITSAARWRRDGWLSRSARNLACLALYRLGVSPERVARLYG